MPATPAAERHDPLAVTLARMVCRRAGSPLLQRVGEVKAGYEEKTKSPELEQAFAELRQRRRDTKDAFKKQFLDGLDAKSEQERRKIMGWYVGVLTGSLEMTPGKPGEWREVPADRRDGDWEKQLRETTPFYNGVLKIDGESIKDAKGNIVATLTRGAAMFEAVANPAGGSRPTYRKRNKPGAADKLYVDDDRNVKTRRLAYVEKSIFQFMHFAHSGSMTGRYQTLHAQMGQSVDMRASVKPALRQDLGLHGRGPISKEALAVIHQWKGSGLEQRGLSLTSTPREGAVFGNAGESFRSADGVSMTIDLAKVPKDGVVLINHYASGGVKDEKGGAADAVETLPKSYGYRASVIKNRELYLERLEPDWVVGLVAHGAALDTTGKTGAALISEAGAKLALASYIAGFGDALRPPAKPSTDASPAYAVGKKAGVAYLEGWRDCKAAAPAKNAWSAMNERYGKLMNEDRKRAVKTHAARRDDYWIGWAHAQAGVATMGGHLGLKIPAPAVSKPVATPVRKPVATPVPKPVATPVPKPVPKQHATGRSRHH